MKWNSLAWFVIIMLFVVAAFTGCKSTDIVQLSPDTYMITVEDHAGIFGGSAAKLKDKTIREANAFAESKGKIAIPVAMKGTPVGGFRDWASFEYQFMVLDKNDPQALRTSLVPRPDIVVQKTDKISADIRTKDETDKKLDLYTELTKLDDLRKKGLITDQEFESQKQKLLNQAN
jgi:hypothetical protein